MIVSMQGNWSLTVKAKWADYPQRFVVSGANTGNGTYNATVGMPAVSVTGDQWSLAIQNDPGSGFRLSNTRVKFPSNQAGNYVFDIESNDAGNDEDFNDLILTCTTAASTSDFLIYGNVTKYSGCLINPCIRRWIVIDTYANLLKALESPRIREVVEKLYPERIPSKIIPNLPDPPPDFKPIMINLLDEMQLPPKMANLYTRQDRSGGITKQPATEDSAEKESSDLVLQRTAVIGKTSSAVSKLTYDRAHLATIVDSLKFLCTTEAAANVTLSFEEYDRTAAELSGGVYTGTGNRSSLGNAITDMHGNYIFRFTLTLSELANEFVNDIASGEIVSTQILPDVIIKVNQLAPFFTALYESAPHFNIQNMRRIDLCLPASKLPASSICFNGNLVGSLGNIFIGGNQNKTASTSASALDRNGYNNHLRSNGKITVHNLQAGFSVDCACWAGTIDVFGCMFNIKRKKDDPIVRRYTIRYRRQGTANWAFVQEAYLHPQFSKRHLPNYNGDSVGPFPTPLHVDGGSAVIVPAYKNIQAEVYADGIDWEWSHLDRYIRLDTHNYDWDNVTNSRLPGTIYFRIDGYDSAGNPVPDATDMIALYINNLPLGFSLNDVSFAGILQGNCNLYKMQVAQLNTPLDITFKANDQWGFLDNYRLAIGKCGGPFGVIESIPGISAGDYPPNAEANNCPGYRGTMELDKFGDVNAHAITYTPDATEDGWLKPTEDYSLFNVSLSAQKRETNGYNTGISGPYHHSHHFAIQKI
jgi:hypothetical protein